MGGQARLMPILAGNIEGSLEIRLYHWQGRVEGVQVSLDRALRVPQVFSGKPMQQAVQLLPRLYSVCSTAQAAAAVEACERAQDLAVSPSHVQARRFLMLLETVKEHLWRIMIIWPRILGEPSIAAALGDGHRWVSDGARALCPEEGPFCDGGGRLAPAKQALGALLRDMRHVLETYVFGERLAVWRKRTTEPMLLDWAAHGKTVPARLIEWLVSRGWVAVGQSPVTPLPVLAAPELHTRLSAADADAFIKHPTWFGRCHETTALTRMLHTPLMESLMDRYANGLLPRLVARLVELAQTMDTLAAELPRLAPAMPARPQSRRGGVGLAQVEAARGRLIHRVQLEDERIRRYQILAPTEWNFHPQGSAARGLYTLRASDPDELRQQASLLLDTIDPCVEYNLYLTALS
jgi:Ni,Fe-hydrogenase I large subunit